MKVFIGWIIWMVLNVLVSLTLWILGYPHAAVILSVTGSLSVFLLVFYVLLFDPMHRWKGVPFGERAFRLLTFQR